MQQEIQIIPSHNIDALQWDSCITASNNSLIYATTSYLNHMATNWSGIVLNNYDGVMPIPWRKKLGITYCYDVPFMQQLGVFTKPGFNAPNLQEELFKFCKYGHYNFNYASLFKKDQCTQQTNFIINLGQDFSAIKQRYNKDLLSNLKRAENFSLSYKPASLADAITAFKRLYADRFSQVHGQDYENFSNLCKQIQSQQQAFVRQVQSTSGEMLSVALFLKDHRRIYNIMNATTPNGKNFEANPFLLNKVLEEFSGTNFIFDFEGSDVPGIKHFYQKFGATDQPYFRLHFNHLPAPIKWLKR